MIGASCRILMWLGVVAATDGSRLDLAREFELLATGADPPKQDVVDDLASHGLEALAFLYESFDEIDHMAKSWFRKLVVPKLPPAETSKVLVDEFRRGTEVLEEVIRLRDREEQEGRSYALEAAYTKIESRYHRWKWSVQAIGTLGHAKDYDVIYVIYRRFTSIKKPHYYLARALYDIEPDRAVRDFSSLVGKTDDGLRLKGVASFRQVGHVPGCKTVARLIDDPIQEIRHEAHQLIYRLDMACLDVLIALSGHQDLRVHRAANQRLRWLAHIPEAHVRELMSMADTRQKWATVWRNWWSRGRHLSEEDRRRNGLAVGLRLAEDNLDRKLLSFLSGFAAFPEVYPILHRALTDADPSLKKGGGDALRRMAGQGDSRAVQFLIDYCTKQPLEETIAFVNTLAKTADPRAVDVLLRMLEEDPSESQTWPRKVLYALGSTGDRRAVAPVLRWLLEKTDGSEQIAAMVLPLLEGAESVQPRLLQRLLREPNHNTRYALRKAMEAIGGEDLAAQLVRVLPQADAGDETFAGPQKDVLLLMEAFPDPAAKPLLLELLETDNRFSHLYAARVLGKLGDDAGVPLLLQDLFTKHPVPFHFHAHDVGQALKDIGAPDTRERLEVLYHTVQGDDRTRVLHAIGQQEDPSYLPFLTRLIDKSDDPAVVSGAGSAVARLIYSVNKNRRKQPVAITEERLIAATLALRWAFHDERMRDVDGPFPDYGLLRKKQGAVLKVGQYEHLLYTPSTKTLRRLSPQNADDVVIIKHYRPRSEDSFAYGKVTWTEYGEFLTLSLGIDHGGASYLFRTGAGRWIPVCYVGGWIE